MGKYTYIIYFLLIGFAVISTVYKKFKKASNQGNNQRKPVSQNQNPKTSYQKPQNTQPKTLEYILKTLMNEQKPPQVQPQKVEKKLISTDKEEFKSTTLEDPATLEKMESEYYSNDTELAFDSEIEDYDQMADHHVHGAGFDEIKDEVLVEEESEWANIDWRKAVISAEILRRPEY